MGEILRKAERGEFPRPRQVNPQVPAPLEAICLKAMARQPKDRYESAAQLADDVEHWLGDEAVAAYRDPLTSQLARWSRRHKAVVASAAVLLLTALVGVSIGAVLLGDANQRIQQQRDVAQSHAQSARQQSELAEKNAQLAEDNARIAEANARKAKDNEQKAEDNARKAEAEAATARAAQQREAQLRVSAERQARIAHALRLAAQSESELEKYPQRSLLLATAAIEATTRVGGPPMPPAEQALRNALATMSGKTLTGHAENVRQLVLSGDGRFAVTCDDKHAVRLWELAVRDPYAAFRVIHGPTEGKLFSAPPLLATSPDGRWLAVGGPGPLLSLWDLKAEKLPGKPARTLCTNTRSISGQGAAGCDVAGHQPGQPLGGHRHATALQ